MPRLPQHAPAVDTITLPHSGVSVTLRRESTGRDHTEAMQAVIGEGYNARHSYMRYLCYMAASLITEWDAEDDEGKAVPISPQELGAMTDEGDYQFLLNDVAGRVTLRGEDDPEKEDPFGQSSTPSSTDTSSTEAILSSGTQSS